MSAQLPPSDGWNSNVLYNPIYFSQGSTSLTQAQADLLYAKLSGSVIRGLTTFQAGLSTATITDAGNTFTMPSSTGTLALTSQIPSLTNYVDLSSVQTLSNKNFSTTCAFTNNVDATKRIVFSNAGMTTNITLTLGTSQATNQTLNFPTVTATDTLMALGLSQTVSGTKTHSGQLVSTRAGQTTQATSPVYVNPASTALSGANDYFFTTFNTPPTTASTTGIASTVSIVGNPTGATNSYALRVLSGVTSIPNGTVSAPTLVFQTGNNTTGIYSSGANNVSCAISGVQVLNTNSTGLTVSGRTTTTTLQVGSGATIFNRFVSGTFSLTFTSVPNQGTVSLAVTYGQTFSSTPIVILTNQNGSVYSGAVLSASGVSTTGFTCFGMNASGTVTGTITVAYIAFN